MARKKRKGLFHRWEKVWWHDAPPTRQELLRRIEPLRMQIRRVDEIVARLAQGAGGVADLVRLEQVLKEPFAGPDGRGAPVMLARPAELHAMLNAFSEELHLEVHTVDGQYPCYLLARVSADYDAPDAVLEELHVSNVRHDFFPDGRFIVLLRKGRSRTFLRLAPFRHSVKTYLAKAWNEPPDDFACDEVLTAVATLVLAAAWYEDQRLPFKVADTFGLRHFRAALELVAFILGSDLYQVATGLQDWGQDVSGFFGHAYENLYLAEFLGRLMRHGAERVTALEDNARQAFQELNGAFSTFLSTTRALQGLEGIALYKIVLGCFSTLAEIASQEHWTPELERAVRTIEASSANCVSRVRSCW